jgi:quercetin dioxygenase-like cupin family protein
MHVANVRDVTAERVEEGAANVRIRWMIDHSKGAPNFAMRHFSIGPDGHTPLHQHCWEHEVYILSGSGVVVSEAGERQLEPGDAVLVEPDETHQFRSRGAEPLELICLVPNDSYR